MSFHTRHAGRRHALRAPAAELADAYAQLPQAPPGPVANAESPADPPPDARRSVYARLARVAVRHTYYNAGGGRCGDFAVRPTQHTAALMRSLGLLFKPEADGFSVLYDTFDERDLLSYLRRQAREDGSVWTRLTFLLSLKNAYFVNFTDIPIDHDPARWNFYLTNQDAHHRGPMVLLSPGRRVTGDERLPVAGGQVVETVGDDVVRVEVCAISGEVALCKPRCVPKPVADTLRPDQFVCDPEAKAGEKDERVCADRLFFDLSVLPEDRYTVQAVLEDGTPQQRDDLVYTSLYPMPLCMVNLLFTDPHAATSATSAPAAPADPAEATTGVYPVSLEGEGAVRGVDYVLRFTRRKTWWNYYVVPQRGGELHELRIAEAPHTGTARRVRFLGPCEVRLPGGQRAYRFLSSRPLPLEQRSRLHLRLSGRTADMHRAQVLVERLAVPSGQQVLPYSGEDACQQAVRALRRPRDPGARCRRLLRHLCGAGPDPGAPGSGDAAPPRDFSDVYVYV
jgi:hypothetical protein